MPLPHDIDTTQLGGLREFRRQIRRQELLGGFSNDAQLEHEVWKAIEFDIDKLDFTVHGPFSTNAHGVRFSAQFHEERELKDYGKRDKARYTTRYWIKIQIPVTSMSQTSHSKSWVRTRT